MLGELADHPVALYQEIVGSWGPRRLLGADSEALAGAGWPECYRTVYRKCCPYIKRSSDPGGLGGCWEQILRSWLELAGQGARGVSVESRGPISRGRRILEAWEAAGSRF